MAECLGLWQRARREVKPVFVAFHFNICHVQSALFLWEMSLSFVEDELLSASPQRLCPLLGPMQGQKQTTVEKKKKQAGEHKHTDYVSLCTDLLFKDPHGRRICVTGTIEIQMLLVSWSRKYTQTLT